MRNYLCVPLEVADFVEEIPLRLRVEVVELWQREMKRLVEEGKEEPLAHPLVYDYSHFR